MQHARVSPTVREVNKSITQPRTWIVGKWSTTHKGQQFVPGSHHLFAINIYPRNTLRGSSGFHLTKVSLRLDNINDGRIVVSRRNEEFLGSAQQSDERRILGGFLESDEFGLGGGQPL